MSSRSLRHRSPHKARLQGEYGTTNLWNDTETKEAFYASFVSVYSGSRLNGNANSREFLIKPL